MQKKGQIKDKPKFWQKKNLRNGSVEPFLRSRIGGAYIHKGELVFIGKTFGLLIYF